MLCKVTVHCSEPSCNACHSRMDVGSKQGRGYSEPQLTFLLQLQYGDLFGLQDLDMHS